MKKLVSFSKITKHGLIRYKVTVPKDLQGQWGTDRKICTTEAEAKALVKLFNASGQSWSAQLMALSDQDKGKFVRCLDLLGSAEVIEKACLLYQRTAAPVSMLLSTAVREYMASKESGTSCSKYVQSIRQHLNLLCSGRETIEVGAITPQEIEEFLQRPEWAHTARRYAHVLLTSFFAWCKKRRYCADNPMTAIERCSRNLVEIGILTPDQVGALLKAAWEIDQELVPYIAIGCFAGLRLSELRKLTPALIHPAHIEVTAAIAKTKSRRIVPVRPVLAEWLAISPPLNWTNWEKNWNKIRLAAGFSVTDEAKPGFVRYPRNAMRHSCISNLVPIIGASLTAEQSGNSYEIIKSNYQELVRPAAVEAYWALTPERVLGLAAPANVVQLAAVG